MRVAVAMPSLVAGGAERVSLELAGGLLDRDIDVDIVLASDEGRLGHEIPAGAQTVVLHRRRVALCLGPLVRYLRSRRPDAIVSCLNHMNVLCVLASRLVRPRPWTVVTEHNTLSAATENSSTRRDRAIPAVVGLTYRYADRIVAVSDGVADDLARVARLPRHRIETVYNPVRFERLVLAASESSQHPWLQPKDAPVVVSAGRLIAQKDFATLLRAVALLSDEIRLIILGEGSERASLEKLAVELGIAHRVDVHGFVANPYPFFSAADVIALSSRWEGLPTVLVEALAFEASIVATDCPSGPREILVGGRWGELVPVGDPVAMAAAIEAAVTTRPSRDAVALDRYRHDVVTERYLQLLSGTPTPGVAE